MFSLFYFFLNPFPVKLTAMLGIQHDIIVLIWERGGGQLLNVYKTSDYGGVWCKGQIGLFSGGRLRMSIVRWKPSYNVDIIDWKLQLSWNILWKNPGLVGKLVLQNLYMYYAKFILP